MTSKAEDILDKVLRTAWWTEFFRNIGLPEADSRTYVTKLRRRKISLRKLPLLNHKKLTAFGMTDENHRCAILEGFIYVFEKLDDCLFLVRADRTRLFVFLRAFLIQVPATVTVVEDDKPVSVRLVRENYFALLTQLSQLRPVDALDPAFKTARIHFDLRKDCFASMFKKCQVEKSKQDALAAKIVLESLRQSGCLELSFSDSL